MAIRIDLGQLQALSARSFEQWDKAVLENDSQLARHARDEIMYLARQHLNELNSSYRDAVGGLYLFANERRNCADSDRLNYIGIVWGQDLYSRMWDYVGKELSVQDPRLLELDDVSALATITARLSVAMPRSEERKIREYTAKHMKSRSMSRANAIYLMPARATRRILEDTESVLIQAALSCGQRLVNKQKLNAAKAAVHQESQSLALDALLAWRREGLNRQLSVALEQAVQNRRN